MDKPRTKPKLVDGVVVVVPGSVGVVGSVVFWLTVNPEA